MVYSRTVTYRRERDAGIHFPHPVGVWGGSPILVKYEN